MPSQSLKQARFVAMLANNPEKAKKSGMSKKLAKEWSKKDAQSGILSKAMKSKKLQSQSTKSRIGTTQVEEST